MHIAIDGRFYGLEHAGLGRYTSNLIHELAKIDSTNSYTLFMWEKYRDIDLPDNFRTVVVDAAHHTVREQYALSKQIYAGSYDLVHFPHFIVPVLSFGTPFIVTIHDLIKHKHGSLEATTLPKWLYYTKLAAYKFDVWWAVHKSRYIITPTDSVKHDIVNWFGINENKLVRTYEGFDNALGQNMDRTEQYPELLAKHNVTKPYLLYVGNSYPYKNLRSLVKALHHLPEELQLVLVGARSVFLDGVMKTIHEEGVQDRVVVAGYVPDDELGVLYNQAEAYVSASLEEGFGITPLEAMGAGCPVIVSDIPVFREVCGDAALYFDPLDPLDIARMISTVFDDQQVRERLRTAGKKKVDTYSWNTMAQETRAVYMRVAEVS